jgi:ketosteroid isomerase-like protein
MSESDQERRERNKEQIRYVLTHLREMGNGSEEGLAPYFAVEVLFEAPYRKVRRLGVDQIHTELRRVADEFTVMCHTDIVFTDGLNPDEFVVESAAEAKFRATGEDYPQRYVVFFKMKDDKIMTQRQYYNTRILHLANDAAPPFA